MNPHQEWQRIAEIERERYLAKLQEKAARREATKALRNKAIELRSEHESRSSQQYLQRMGRRAEFRAHVHANWLNSHRAHEQMLQKLGQIYRERLTLQVGRTLESATLRTAVNKVVIPSPPTESSVRAISYE